MADPELQSRECEQCIFYMAFMVAPEQGQCRRSPPTILQNRVPLEATADEIWGHWPMVSADDWCGEWSPNRMAVEAKP